MPISDYFEERRLLEPVLFSGLKESKDLVRAIYLAMENRDIHPEEIKRASTQT